MPRGRPRASPKKTRYVADQTSPEEGVIASVAPNSHWTQVLSNEPSARPLANGSRAPLHAVPRNAPFSMRPGWEQERSRSPAKVLCAEGQNRTGDTWFFRSCSQRLGNLRLNARAMTHGYDQRQMVQHEERRAGFASVAVTTEITSETRSSHRRLTKDHAESDDLESRGWRKRPLADTEL